MIRVRASCAAVYSRQQQASINIYHSKVPATESFKTLVCRQGLNL